MNIDKLLQKKLHETPFKLSNEIFEGNDHEEFKVISVYINGIKVEGLEPIIDYTNQEKRN